MGQKVVEFPSVVTLVVDETLARWLGLQAAREGAIADARAWIDPSVVDAFEAGAGLPASTILRHGLTEARRKAYIRELQRLGSRRAPVATGALPASIVKIVQRKDVGTSTRYDMTLRSGKGKTVELRDLRATDILSWERLRPIACDARMVLPSLGRGEGGRWVEEVERAMESVEECEMAPEESEAMEIRQALLEMAMAARPWTWTADDPMPVGLARIDRGPLVGWTRGPMQQEVRTRMGRVSRVALRRAIVSLGWVRREWEVETAYLRVWTMPAEDWPALVRTSR